MRAILILALGVCALATAPNASAQSGDGYLAFVEWCRSIGGTHVPGPGYGRCDPGTGSPSGGLYAPDGWGARAGTAINQWFRRQLSGEAANDARRQRAVQINNQANTTSSLDDRLRMYRQADELWSSPVIRLNLIEALIRVAGREYQNRNPQDATALDRMEQFLNEAEGLNREDVQSVEGYAEVIGWLNAGRNLIAQARAELATAARHQAALGDASARISQIAGDLAAEIGSNQATAASGLGFGDPTAVADLRDGPNSPPPLPPSAPSVPPTNSPGYQAWLRGMDAVAQHDWELAAAWFGTAQLRDPNNEALQRAVDLAEWTRDFYRRPDARAAASLQLPQDADLDLLFDPHPLPAQLPGMTPEERQRVAIAHSSNTPLPEDLDLLMRDSVQDRNEMVETMPFQERRHLATRGVTLPPANDWTDQLAPEVRGMLAELRQALPPRTYGPLNPTASPNDVMTAGVAELSHGFADDAIVRVLYGDLGGAERALGEASQFGGADYSRALQLVRQWRGGSQTNNLGLAPGDPARR